jgi:hypothetical protein
MPVSTLLTLLGVLQTIIQDTPEAITLFNTVKAAMTQDTPPTPEQWEVLVTAYNAAHAKVQAA